MTSSSPFDNDALPRNAANYAPLTPLTFIRRAADVHGDRCAVVYGDQAWTWSQTYRRCCKLASALCRRGIGKNDTVAVLAPNVPALYEAHFGVPMAGAILNAINTRLDARTVALILAHGSARLVMAHRSLAPLLTDALLLLPGLLREKGRLSGLPQVGGAGWCFSPQGASPPKVRPPPRCFSPQGASPPKVRLPPRCFSPQGASPPKVLLPPRCFSPQGASPPKVLLPPRCFSPQGASPPKVLLPPRCFSPQGASPPKVLLPPRCFSPKVLLPQGASPPKVLLPPRCFSPQGASPPKVLLPPSASPKLLFPLPPMCMRVGAHVTPQARAYLSALANVLAWGLHALPGGQRPVVWCAHTAARTARRPAPRVPVGAATLYVTFLPLPSLAFPLRQGVVCTHRGAYLSALANVLAWGLHAQPGVQRPVYLWTLPLFHCNGWTFPWVLAAVAGTNVCCREVTGPACHSGQHLLSHFPAPSHPHVGRPRGALLPHPCARLPHPTPSPPLHQVTAASIFSLILRRRVTHMCAAPVVLSFLIHAPDSLRLPFLAAQRAQGHGGSDYSEGRWEGNSEGSREGGRDGYSEGNREGSNRGRQEARRVHVMTAGAAPPPAVLAGIEAMGFEVLHAYGLTETYGPAVVCEWQDERWRGADEGERARLKARQGVRCMALEGLAVMDPVTMRHVAADGRSMGEVMLRGNMVMKGYAGDPQATEAAFRGGWFHSGDLAVMHPDGYIELK
ncbi:unnamed protein product, partial [Closterium sp. Naga37s-1]